MEIVQRRNSQNKYYQKRKPPVKFQFYRIIVICESDYINTKILNSQTYWNPSVGVGVFVVNKKEETLLIGRRKDSNLFGLPGGWLELGETWEDCAKRELKEETGLEMNSDLFKHIYTLNCKMLTFNFHNISCIMYLELDSLECIKVENMEPHKCLGWDWLTLEELRKNLDGLFYPLRDFFQKFPKLQKVSDLESMCK